MRRQIVAKTQNYIAIEKDCSIESIARWKNLIAVPRAVTLKCTADRIPDACL